MATVGEKLEDTKKSAEQSVLGAKEKVQQVSHDAAKAAVHAFDYTSEVASSTYNNIAESDTGKAVLGKVNEVGAAVNKAGKSASEAVGKKIDELRKE